MRSIPIAPRAQAVPARAYPRGDVTRSGRVEARSDVKAACPTMPASGAHVGLPVRRTGDDV